MNRIGIHRIANAITIPVEGKIVACPPRQHMHMNMWHRLSGEFSVRLHKAQSGRLQRLVHRTGQPGNGCAHSRKTFIRHFAPAYDRSGSISTFLADATRGLMSAVPPAANQIIALATTRRVVPIAS
jgi:hypothetical protein